MSKLTVLVADDDRTTRSIITSILEGKDYQVDTADRGEKCLFLALENTYDAILVDINMPGLSGIDLCRRLREINRYKMVPIIVVTTLHEEFILTEAFSVGASDFVSKPVNPTVLTERLKSHIDKKHYYDELERARNYLNRYISSRTQRIVEAYSVTGLLPSPEFHEVSIMFTDIRGFTSMSQKTEPEELFYQVSKELGKQVNLVYEYKGYIDKFGGDGLMAIFDGESSVKHACQCAWHIINSRITDPFLKNQEPLPIGIGIHYGSVIIGNIGSEEHLDYSALGDSVNLAARLCANTDSMQISVSAAVSKILSDDPNFTFAAPEDIEIKGYKDRVSVQSLVSVTKSSDSH